MGELLSLRWLTLQILCQIVSAIELQVVEITELMSSAQMC